MGGTTQSIATLKFADTALSHQACLDGCTDAACPSDSSNVDRQPSARPVKVPSNDALCKACPGAMNCCMLLSTHIQTAHPSKWHHQILLSQEHTD